MWSPPGDCGPVGATCEDPTKNTGENNHQGIVEFPEGSGRLYFAYHTRVLSKSRGEYLGYQRNVAIDRLYARANATTYPLPAGLPWVVDPPGGPGRTGFVPVSATPSWSRQLKYVDAFSTIPATLSAAMSLGLDSEPCAEGGLNLGYVSNGSTTMLRGVDFGAGASAVTLRVATPLSGVSVDVLVDGRAVVSGCAVPNTGDWQTWANITCALAPAAQGVAANLTLRFSCSACTGGLLNVRYFSFTASGPRVAAAVPPPVTVPVALRAMSNGLYVQVASDPSSSGLLTPSGAAASSPLDPSLLFTLVDNEDGTFSLQAAGAGPAQGRFVCATLGGAGPLRASEASTADACTRFWLYGTVYGTHALLSASNGRFVVSGASAAPLVPTAQDPRGAAGDGSRFMLEEQ